MESVEDAGGSTVKPTAARHEHATTGRTGGRDPRPTAIRPAITPVQPSPIAAHSDTVTNVAVRCSECHHGGPLTLGMEGTETFGPAAETAIMISVAAAMAAAPSPPIRRGTTGAPGR